MRISHQKVLVEKRSLTVEMFVSCDQELICCDVFILKQIYFSFFKIFHLASGLFQLKLRIISIWKEKVYKIDNRPLGHFNLFFFPQFQKVQDDVERPPLYRPPPVFCDGKL